MLKFDESVLGQHSNPLVVEVERGAIRKFADALGLTDPIYRSPEAAQRQGYRDVVAPPTFPVTMLPPAIPGLELPSAGVLHGEQQFEWGAPICARDTLRVTGWVEDAKTRSGQQGKMTIITIATEGVNQLDEWAFRTRAVLVVTEAAQTDGESSY